MPYNKCDICGRIWAFPGPPENVCESCEDTPLSEFSEYEKPRAEKVVKERLEK